MGQSLSCTKLDQAEYLTSVQVSELPPESGYLPKALLVHVWKSQELLKIIHQPSISDRLLHLLLWLPDQFEQPIATGTRLDLRLTHQDLADTIGSTRVSVTRLLNQMERQGKIERSQRNLILCL